MQPLAVAAPIMALSLLTLIWEAWHGHKARRDDKPPGEPEPKDADPETPEPPPRCSL